MRYRNAFVIDALYPVSNFEMHEERMVEEPPKPFKEAAPYRYTNICYW